MPPPLPAKDNVEEEEEDGDEDDVPEDDDDEAEADDADADAEKNDKTDGEGAKKSSDGAEKASKSVADAKVQPSAAANNNSKDSKDGGKAATKAEDAPVLTLGEIAVVNAFIANTKVEGLQPLHQLCYDAAGKANVMRKNLRKFDGFEFDRESDEFQKRLDAANKMDLAKLTALCEGLGVPKKGAKEELAKRVCEFLLAPEGEEEPAEEDEEEEDEEEEKSAGEEKSEDGASSEEEAAAAKKGAKNAKSARGRQPAKKQAATSRSSAGRPRRSTAGRTRGIRNGARSIRHNTI